MLMHFFKQTRTGPTVRVNNEAEAEAFRGRK